MIRENGRIKVIAVDLDGTLLDRNTQVPARNAAAIRRAQEQGVGVILATGKTRESAEPIIEQLNITLPGVYFQGHLICDRDGRVLREKAMAPAYVDEAFAYITAHGLTTVVYDRDGLWASAPGYFRDVISRKYAEPLPQIKPRLVNENGINKILIGVDGDAGALRRDLEARFDGRLRVLQAIPEYVELMSLDVSKGEGVAWLLAYLGIAPEALLAVGDGENDIEMLQLAGIGAAVANASAAVKAAADVVVAGHEAGGVAEALERFVLNGDPSAAAPV